jgi:hypothetical protein
MSDLYERLLAEVDRYDPDRLIRFWRSVRAVVELHAPRPCNCTEARHVICATKLTIAEALGVPTGDETT